MTFVTYSQTVSTLAGSTAGSADANGANAQFSGPSGVVVDPSGNLYVSDMNNPRIRKITGSVSTLAGSGTAGCGNRNKCSIF